MNASNQSNSSARRSRFYKKLKRKVFYSNELKKALLISYYEAKTYKTFVDLDLFLYGIISQPESLASRILSLTASRFRNNSLTSKVISSRFQKKNQKYFRQKLLDDKYNKFSAELLNENKQTPWLTPEIKEVLRSATNVALQTRKKIVIVNTKHLLFCLLNKESVCSFLRNLIN
uniref:N-domain of Clp chaperone n=1 Tax=Eustigmatophyceae sp. Ndem 8/9T-3m6.8 TaxID=2506146 RepID=A0A3R5WXD9_9STRA|nr:N-domain of Clp chaperone [Eustigmatophyceae sp. Ndem 8/9T-3m6.8]QAA11904.1 N-domain of Clp chaperone [Eustigmatophyceae sp. Ndem 8/9T-3m6.8]